MRNEQIRERYMALTTLAQRTLPSPTAINKVHFLLSDRFQRPFEATEEGRKAVMKKHPSEGDERDVPARILEERQWAMDAYMKEETPLRKVPDHMRLRSADMPKAMKGDEGWKNTDGLAQIRRMLGNLYVREGDELVKDQPEGFETDDAPAVEIDPLAEHTASE